MRPTCLHGHERSITSILFNREGDLIFTAAKNPDANVWFSANGERLGSYEGHAGAMWCLDVDWTTTYLLTGSGDSSAKVWDVSCGKTISTIVRNSPVRCCGFSYSGNVLFLVTDEVMGQRCELRVLDRRDGDHMQGKSAILSTKGCPEKTKITSAVWGPVDESIICGYESGGLGIIDVPSGLLSKQTLPHKGMITDLKMYVDGTMFISASKDQLATLHNSYNLDCLRTYKTERPVNSAAISPTRDHVLLGGGQEARDVTSSAIAAGKFDARFYHMIYEEEFGQVKGHFGPINSVAFRPDGSGFATGGEDGYVRLHTFDSDYADVEQRLF